MWNRFLLNPSAFRAQIVGASLTLVFPAVLAMSCSAASPTGGPNGSGGNNATGSGGKSAAGGSGPAPCANMCGTPAACVDVKTDAKNCGACNTVCGTDKPFCVSATCSANCPTPLCNGACVDFTTSASNCGACGTACSASQTCTAGVCTAIPVGSGGSGSGGGSSTGGGSSSGGSGGGTVVAPPGRNGCVVKAGMISDFEEGAAVMAPVVIASEGRTGTWGIFNDASKTTEKMTVEASGGTADCDKFALHVTGSGYNDYVGFGMNFAGTGEVPTVYDGAAKQFTGIRFKAKAGSGADPKSPVRFNISTPFTEDIANPPGACKVGAKTTEKAERPCYQHLGKFLPPGTGADQLTTTFKSYTFCFDRDLYPLSLPSNLKPADRDATAANLLKLQFQFNQGKDYSNYPAKGAQYPLFAKSLPFDFWVDDVEFITGECSSPVTPSPSNGSPAKAFPQNAGVGSCMPATNASKFSSAIAKVYANWVKTFVKGKTIVAPEQENHVTSEAMGYGLLIAAAMGDKAQFDAFAEYAGSGLLKWRDDQSGSASDADLDIAYAYLMANLQWPGAGYDTKSNSVADGIKSSDIVDSVITGGSMFHDAPYNPSYFAPAWMRKLKGLSDFVAKNYTLVDANVTAGTSGVPTDWADKVTGKPAVACCGVAVTSDITDGGGAMGYDAARVPWRLGMDVCKDGGNKTSLKAIVDFFAAKYDAGASIDLMKAGWIKSSGAVHPLAVNMQGSYIGPIGVGAMAMGNTVMRDRAFRALLDILESGDYNHTYFPSTVGLLSLLALSGNFPTP